MDIITPPRIESLGSQSIRVKYHGNRSKLKTFDIQGYAFETIFSIKQRISQALMESVEGGGKRAFFPAHLFVATATSQDHYRPIEFSWPFTDPTLPDPLAVGVKGVLNPELMEGDVRRAVFPKLLAGITLESSIPAEKEAEIHVWSLADLAADLELSEILVSGYFQTYFPALQTAADVFVAASQQDLSDPEKENVAFTAAFQARSLESFGRIDGFLKDAAATAASEIPAPPQLQDLRILRIMLPNKPIKESLEILFHETAPTRAAPLFRFFPSEQRQPPLLKLATGATGIPTITDTKLLRVLMMDTPVGDKGAIMLVKAPLTHPKAPMGAAWTLRIYENGDGELIVGAPRRDAPLSAAVMSEAFQQLPSFLAPTPWRNLNMADATLVEITATYEYVLKLDIRKPSRSELQKRGELFRRLYQEEKPLAGEPVGILSLRWKAVSNFKQDVDPVMVYISDLFLKDSNASIETIPTAAYVGALGRTFGLGPAEAGHALNTWINRHAEYVLVETEGAQKAVAAYSMGALVSIYNLHPIYRFQIAKVESFADLQRILGTLEVWVSHTAAELTPAAVAAAAPEPEPEAEQVEEWMQAMEMYGMDFGLAADSDNSDGAINADTAAAAADDAIVGVQESSMGSSNDESTDAKAVLKIQSDIRFPEPLGAEEAPLPPLKEFLISQIKQRDKDLISYSDTGDKRVRLYTRSCQNNANKQPNIMSAETYSRVRSLYGDSVHWLEAPLSNYDAEAVAIASKTVDERSKLVKEIKGIKDKAEEEAKKNAVYERIAELEKRALRIGFPIKDGKSILTLWKKGPGMTDEMRELFAYQASKPLWIVVRAGTTKPNYYVCAEFWCIRDDLPITNDDFHGTRSRTGATKEADTCPFCGGRKIQDVKTPAKGETVLQRGPATKGGSVPRFAGYLSDLYHPKLFALPCCFVDPNNMLPAQGSVPIPPAAVELPSILKEGFERNAAAAAAKKAAAAAAAATTVATTDIPPRNALAAFAAAPVRNIMDVFEDVRMKMDFSEGRFKGLEDKYRFLDKEQTKIELKAKKILRTYILEATSFPLEMGKIGILPPAVDTFLGQDRKNYLEKHGGEIYTHPDVKAQAFFRLGLGVLNRNAGAMILQLIAYARSAVSFIAPPLEPLAASPEDVLKDMFEVHEVATFYAFQQANYGMLATEFADPTRPVIETEFQTWCGRVGFPLPEQRTHASELYRAWLNFQDYVRDLGHAKELRLWEHLFAAPGLFTSTGVILAVLTTDAADRVVLRCPSLGISPRDQMTRPPILLLYEDRKSHLCEPIVLFSGPDQLLGVLDPESVVFGQLPPNIRTPLAAFYSDYFDPKGGCGRPETVPHPWIADDRPQTGIPRLGSLIAAVRRQDGLGATVQCIIRDRSRRVVGLRVEYDGASILVPAVDDGTIDVSLGSLYDTEAVSYAPLQSVLAFLMGPVSGPKKGGPGLAALFPGLTPVELRSMRVGEGSAIVALECRAGAMIPVEPTRLDVAISHPAFAALQGSVGIDFLPWMENSIAMDDATDADAIVLQNPEEQLEEAYQHLRLTMSHWLNTDPKGKRVKKLIENLRSSHLPLYELRRRMQIILQDTVPRWIHVGAATATKSEKIDSSESMLRRNCLKMRSEGKCVGSCVWVKDGYIDAADQGGVCRIHGIPTRRYVDPVVVLVGRLVDELLRTHTPAMQILQERVARLRVPKGVVREKDSVLMAVEGHVGREGHMALGLEGRLPTRYTRGLVFPEEQGEEDVGCEPTARGIPLTWEGIQAMRWPAALTTTQEKREVAWAGIVGKPWDAIAPLFGRGEVAGFTAIAEEKGLNIILTRDSCGGFRLFRWIAPATVSHRFVILDADRLPLASVKTGQPILQEAELPTVILQWLDSAKRGIERAEQGEVDAALQTPVEDLMMGDTMDEERRPYEMLKEAERRNLLEARKEAERQEVAKVAAAAAAPPPPKPKKPCPPGMERSDRTGDCVKICPPGQIRTESGRCKKAPKAPKAAPQVIQPVDMAEDIPAAVPELPPAELKPKKPCPEGKERSAQTGECIKKCPPGQERTESGRCKKTKKAPRPKTPPAPAAAPAAAAAAAPAPVPNKVANLPAPVEVVAGPVVPIGPKPKKPCPEGQERSERTGDCIKKCPPGQERVDSGRCKKVKKVKGMPPQTSQAPPVMIIEEDEEEPEEEEPEEEEEEPEEEEPEEEEPEEEEEEPEEEEEEEE